MHFNDIKAREFILKSKNILIFHKARDFKMLLKLNNDSFGSGIFSC